MDKLRLLLDPAEAERIAEALLSARIYTQGEQQKHNLYVSEARIRFALARFRERAARKSAA